MKFSFIDEALAALQNLSEKFVKKSVKAAGYKYGDGSLKRVAELSPEGNLWAQGLDPYESWTFYGSYKVDSLFKGINSFEMDMKGVERDRDEDLGEYNDEETRQYVKETKNKAEKLLNLFHELFYEVEVTTTFYGKKSRDTRMTSYVSRLKLLGWAIWLRRNVDGYADALDSGSEKEAIESCKLHREKFIKG